MRRSPVVLVLFVSIVQAFLAYDWPDDPDGTEGVSHTTITRRAFNNIAQVYWPNLVISRSMIRARDTIISANAAVDDD